MSEAVVPIIMTVRTQSQRYPKKVIRPFYGEKNLVEIAAEKYRGNPNFYIAGNEAIFEDIAKKNEVSYIHRTNESVMAESVADFLSFIDEMDCEAICWINACCPLTKVETIEQAISRYCSEGCQTLMPIVHDGEIFFNDKLQPLTDDATTANSKLRKPVYRLCNNYKIFNRKHVMDHGIFFKEYLPGDPFLLSIDEAETPDIDTEAQFQLFKILYESVCAKG